jgi:late competence protein required for DNA uptake (superfamily II DNA/RNA helicase)
MAGRVGRSVADPYGECYFLALQRSENIDRCIASINRANECQ